MTIGQRIILFGILGILLAVPSCGKKGPPFLPQKAFPVKVTELRGERDNGFILLKGNIQGVKGQKKDRDLVKGCQVFYGKYPLENPPCEDCPIEYQGYHEFGKEVIRGEGFFCRVPGKSEGQIYFFKVHLIGPERVVGPPSNRVRVVVE